MSPTIFTKTPKEHMDAELARRDDLGYDPVKAAVPAPPGYIQVQFYTSLNRIRRCQDPDLIGSFPLEPNGSLSLERVAELWGLESCVAIDPMRWQETAAGSVLSPLAVFVLSERQQHIKIIEPPISKKTMYIRSIRQCLIFPFIISRMLLELTFDSLEPRRKSLPTPESLVENKFEWEKRSRGSIFVPQYGARGVLMAVLLNVLVLIMFVIIAMRYLHFEPRAMVYNWAKSAVAV
ncbi:hypothetical protein C8J56DRAFT_886792 [Mycena floridula]|nr:hypothetical protein C8J56DRAFT_886792 [Mycena floridula]